MIQIAKLSVLPLLLVFTSLLTGASAVLFSQSVALAFVGIAALALVLVLPELRSVPFQLSKLSFYSLVFCMLSVPDYYALVISGLPWISVRRVVLFTCIGATLITLAGSSYYRERTWEKFKSLPIISISFLGFWINSFVSTFQSSSFPSALNTFINQNMSYYIPFVAGVMVLNDQRDVARMMKVMLVCVFIDMILGGIEFSVHHPFLIQALPPLMQEQIVSSTPAYQVLVTPSGFRNGMYRAGSVYIVALSWGEMCAMMAPVALYFILFSKSWSGRLFGLVGFFTSVISIVFSGSRGAYVGLLAGTSSYMLFWCLRQVRQNPMSLMGPLLLIAASIVTATVASAVLFVGRVHTIVLGGGAAQASNMGRSQQWALAWPRVFSRPLFGYGPGTGPDVVGWTTPGGFPSLDSYFINLLVSVGFIGFALFFIFFISCMFACVRTYVSGRSAESAALGSFAAGLLAFCIYRYTLNQTENMTLVYVMSAACISLLNMAPAATKAKTTTSSHATQNYLAVRAA